jgi:hypothetical protein
VIRPSLRQLFIKLQLILDEFAEIISVQIEVASAFVVNRRIPDTSLLSKTPTEPDAGVQGDLALGLALA